MSEDRDWLLDLANRDLKDENVEEVCQKSVELHRQKMGRHNVLEYQEIDASQNSIGWLGCKTLVDVALQCEDLRVVKLSRNELTDSAAPLLCRLVEERPELEQLHLSYNQFTAQGASDIIASASRARSSRASTNQPGDEGITLWLRLEKNRVRLPTEMLEALRRGGADFCEARDTQKCGPRMCKRGALVHLPYFSKQEEPRTEPETPERAASSSWDAGGSPRVPVQRDPYQDTGGSPCVAVERDPYQVVVVEDDELPPGPDSAMDALQPQPAGSQAVSNEGSSAGSDAGDSVVGASRGVVVVLQADVAEAAELAMGDGADGTGEGHLAAASQNAETSATSRADTDSVADIGDAAVKRRKVEAVSAADGARHISPAAQAIGAEARAVVPVAATVAQAAEVARASATVSSAPGATPHEPTTRQRRWSPPPEAKAESTVMVKAPPVEKPAEPLKRRPRLSPPHDAEVEPTAAGKAPPAEKSLEAAAGSARANKAPASEKLAEFGDARKAKDKDTKDGKDAKDAKDAKDSDDQKQKKKDKKSKKDKEREKDKEKEEEKEREREREKEHEKEKEKDNDRGRDRDRERNRDRNRDREKEEKKRKTSPEWSASEGLKKKTDKKYGKEAMDTRDAKEAKEKETRGSENVKESKEAKGSKDVRAVRGAKDSKNVTDSTDAKESKDARSSEEAKSTSNSNESTDVNKDVVDDATSKVSDKSQASVPGGASPPASRGALAFKPVSVMRRHTDKDKAISKIFEPVMDTKADAKERKLKSKDFKDDAKDPKADASATSSSAKKPKAEDRQPEPKVDPKAKGVALDLGNLKEMQKRLEDERNKLRLWVIQAKQEWEERQEKMPEGQKVIGATDEEDYYRCSEGEVFGPNNQFRCEGSIGNGVFSSVFRVKNTAEGADYAIKFIRANTRMRKAAEKEMETYRKLQRTAASSSKRDQEACHYLMFLSPPETFVHKGHLCMVFALQKCDLRTALQKYGQGRGLPLQTVVQYSRQLFTALRVLRQWGVIHGDLKPDNVLLSMSKTEIKVCDFGSAFEVIDKINTAYLQPRYYRAPEIIVGHSYDTQIDLWSLAVTLFELASGKILFTGKSNNAMLRQMLEVCGAYPRKMASTGAFASKHFRDGDFLFKDPDTIIGEEVMPMKRFAPPKRPISAMLEIVSKEPPPNSDTKTQERLLPRLADLVTKCLQWDAAERVSPEQALEHAFYKKDK